MQLPTDSERILIAGHTGSGKTHEALHHLSQRSIDEKPWIILDFKGDDLVSSVPVTAPADKHAPPPVDPGLYVVRVSWEDAEPGGLVDRYLLAICDQRRTGVFIDEGQMLGHRNRGIRTLLTQGRSYECPLIFVTQRPCYVDTFAFSEADYLQLFLLTHPDDKERVAGYVPRDRLDFDRLRAAGEHRSFLYDVRHDRIEILEPAPPFGDIYDRILTRLPTYEEEGAGDTLPRRVRV